MSRILVVITFSVLIFTITACSSKPTIESSPTQTPVPAETSTKTPVPTRKPTGTPTPAYSAVDTGGSPLRTYAQQRDFYIGAAVAYEPLAGEPLYAQTLGREFNMLTAENVMKFDHIHPAQDAYNFTEADALVAFALENDMQVRGHVLVWHSQLPDWLTDQTWTREELMDILHDHITTVVSRYKGQITAWDVINEGIADNGKMRNTIWYKTIGPEYIDLAFQWAHEADTDALLFYNDYNAEGIGNKSTAVYNLVRDLIERGITVHGVGLQFHAELNTSPKPQDLRLNIKQLAELGLVVHITEMDIRIRLFASESDLIKQANIYYGILQACLEFDACQALVLWGFTDKHSWIPYSNKGFGSALPFDEEYQPKPAYNALIAALAE